jgi:hypothetical protein
MPGPFAAWPGLQVSRVRGSFGILSQNPQGKPQGCQHRTFGILRNATQNEVASGMFICAVNIPLTPNELRPAWMAQTPISLILPVPVCVGLRRTARQPLDALRNILDNLGGLRKV